MDFIKLCGGNPAPDLQTAFIHEALTLPARYLYHSLELLWSRVAFPHLPTFTEIR